MRRALLALLALLAGTLAAAPALAQTSSLSGNAPLLSGRQRLVNGNFAVNQRAVSSNFTAYAAGAYTVDRWKAGAGGATTGFALSANGDAAANTSSGTILQVIEGGLYLLEGGTYTLSWTGTGTCRAYQGTASGSYVASPLTVTGWTAGTNGTVECQGLVGLIQFEPGAVATAFERRDDEMRRSQRYYQISAPTVAYTFNTGGLTNAAFGFATPMRATPALANVAVINGTGQFDRPGAGTYNVTGVNGLALPGTVQGMVLQLNTSATSAGVGELGPGLLAFGAEL